VVLTGLLVKFKVGLRPVISDMDDARVQSAAAAAAAGVQGSGGSSPWLLANGDKSVRGIRRKSGVELSQSFR
jgi:hypothetical protein